MREKRQEVGTMTSIFLPVANLNATPFSHSPLILVPCLSIQSFFNIHIWICAYTHMYMCIPSPPFLILLIRPFTIFLPFDSISLIPRWNYSFTENRWCMCIGHSREKEITIFPYSVRFVSIFTRTSCFTSSPHRCLPIPLFTLAPFLGN